ncbi:MAG: hypothetical protein ACI97A_002409 [Planctomycetota bacterium]|jgi:hypothetical protein
MRGIPSRILTSFLIANSPRFIVGHVMNPIERPAETPGLQLEARKVSSMECKHYPPSHRSVVVTSELAISPTLVMTLFSDKSGLLSWASIRAPGYQ